MELLIELNEKNIGLAELERFEKPYRLRKAVRAILLDENNNMALMPVAQGKYYKLPGGGVDVGEDLQAALLREIDEEVGCNAEIITPEPFGVIVEYRNEQDMVQISYCYIAKCVGSVGEQKLEQGEIDAGFLPAEWISLDDAKAKTENDVLQTYSSKFITKRDTTFITKAKDVLKK